MQKFCEIIMNIKANSMSRVNAARGMVGVLHERVREVHFDGEAANGIHRS